MPALTVFPHDPITGYELLDCGHGEKLERVSGLVLRRPDPQAMWRPLLPPEEWDRADLVFERESDRGGRWRTQGKQVPEHWVLQHGDARLALRPTPFKHIGIFPEQAANWLWTKQQLAALPDQRPKLLNLFAYTGVATVLASQAGAFVTHVDSSKPSLRWAKDNARLSGLGSDAVRWIQDDVLAFVRREVRRGKLYDGILLDPPPYGRGPEGEKWVFEEMIVELLETCRSLLSPGAAFLVLSCYAVGTSPLAFLNMLSDLGPGDVEAGELALPQQGSDRLLPAGLCGRWVRSNGA
jgi:23S rRNA (cytosine1962-C5)-methyltransferase